MRLKEPRDALHRKMRIATTSLRTGFAMTVIDTS